MNSKPKNTPEHTLITKETVQHVAHLARIELSRLELERLVLQLQDILYFIDKLKKIDITGINPTSHILPLRMC